MSNKEIDQNITRLRKLVLGETNVNTLKEIIKCVDQVQFDFLKLNRQLNRSKLEIQDIYNVNLKKSSSLD